MAYIVQAHSQNSEDHATSVTLKSRKDALARAVDWLEDGKSGVKIIGDGRIYTPTEFAMTLGDDIRFSKP